MSTPVKSLLHVVLAIATWLSLLPVGALVAGHDHLVETGIGLAVVAVVGAVVRLLGAGAGGVLTCQVLAAIGVVVWRAAVRAPDAAFLDRVPQLLTAGRTEVGAAAPPLDEGPGVLFLALLLALAVLLICELLVSVLEQPAWSFAPLWLGFVISGIASPEELSLGAFAACAAAYVLVLVTATGIGDGHRAAGASRQGPFHVARVVLAAVLAVAAIGATAAVQPLLPIGEKQPWARGGSGPIQLGDPTVELNENLLQPADEPVFTYRSSDGRPLYFRTVALPDLTADGARLVPMRLRGGGLDGAYSAPGEEVRVDVQMHDVPSEYLPLPFAVDRFDAGGQWSFDPDTLAVVATGPDRTEQTIGLTYSAVSTVPRPEATRLLKAQAGKDADEITTVKPEVDPRVEQLTKRVVGDAVTDGAKARAIESFLRSDAFTYSVEAPQSASLDVISAFLLDSREGYCIHFASAMMTMARLEGIPSRMAIGFTPGTHLADGSYEVTSHNMHAWPELYFEGLGWVAFEPTPSVAEPPETPDPSGSESASPEPSPSPSASPSASTSPAPSPSPTPAEPVPPADDEEDATGLPGWLLPGLGALLGVALLLSLPALVRAATGAWRLRGGRDAGATARDAWREVHATFRDVGLPWPEGSPGPAARRAARDVPDGALLVGVGADVERALFARDGADTSTLPDRVRTLRRGLRRSAPWWRRWWPASLGRR